MFLELAAAGFLISQYVYHRWIKDPDVVKVEPQEVGIPRVDEGAPVPLIYGRVRVRTPILVWTDTPHREDANPVNNDYDTGTFVYRMNMFFVLGIGMADGEGTNQVHGMWSGEAAFFSWGSTPKETDIITEIGRSRKIDVGSIGGSAVQWYDGNPLQDIGAEGAGVAMMAATPAVDVFQIPAYVGYITVLLADGAGTKWRVGSRPSVAQYSFEVSSYKTDGGYPAPGVLGRIGPDSNPINVLHDLLVAKFGKLGYDEDLVDAESFADAAATLYSESHGYSRCIEDVKDADEHIMEILRQIDAALYEDPVDGTIKIKLIRPDFDPLTIPHITKANCDDITNFAMGGWTGVPNEVRVVYTNRDDSYQEGSETDQNPANAVGQDGQVRKLVLSYPGCTHSTLAKAIARRELAARSGPIIKMRALVDRSFLRVNPGDAVKVTWTGPDIAGLIFRVASVDRGTLEDGRIALDLISDFNYTWRNETPESPVGAVVGDVRISIGS